MRIVSWPLPLLHTGDIADARAHYDQAIGLYDPARASAACHFVLVQDIPVTILSFPVVGFVVVGYAEAALLDADYAVKDVRGISQAASLMYALYSVQYLRMPFVETTRRQKRSLMNSSLCRTKKALRYRGARNVGQGSLIGLIGEVADAVHNDNIGDFRYALNGNKGCTCPSIYLFWPGAGAGLGQFDDAWRCMSEAITIETTGERWFEAEVNRVAGEIALSRRARCRESRSVFRARARSCAPTASQILGTPRRNEPRAPLA